MFPMSYIFPFTLKGVAAALKWIDDDADPFEVFLQLCMGQQWKAGPFHFIVGDDWRIHVRR